MMVKSQGNETQGKRYRYRAMNSRVSDGSDEPAIFRI